MTDDRFRYSAENCSIRRTLDFVGERWSLLILREAFYGVTRFDDFVRAIGCPRDALTARLKTLVDAEILSREPYKEPGQRARREYHLTDKGRDLLPALLALMQWGDKWAADDAGPAVIVRHRGCDAPLTVAAHCDRGHGPLSPRDIAVTPGPGARLAA